MDVDIAIVGSGFSGLGLAVRLKREGIEDFVVLERGDGVGGTWHYNTYPGCACDVPSHLLEAARDPGLPGARGRRGRAEPPPELRGPRSRVGRLALGRRDEP